MIKRHLLNFWPHCKLIVCDRLLKAINFACRHQSRIIDWQMSAVMELRLP